MKIYLPHAPSHSSSLRGLLKHRCKRGFALIATISVMILLVMIALAMLSLSTIELRASQNGRAMAEAQANARMALMLAIGNLQKHAGSDMRITAPADILDESYPPALGVWRSWEGTDHEASGTLKGRPKAPDYSSKTKSASDSGRFVSWLVSGADANSLPADITTLIQNTPSAGTVPLLAAGTLEKSDTRQVHCIPQDVNPLL
jgi:type II secretory pathway pseudopilin PulG